MSFDIIRAVFLFVSRCLCNGGVSEASLLRLANTLECFHGKSRHTRIFVSRVLSWSSHILGAARLSRASRNGFFKSPAVQRSQRPSLRFSSKAVVDHFTSFPLRERTAGPDPQTSFQTEKRGINVHTHRAMATATAWSERQSFLQVSLDIVR